MKRIALVLMVTLFVLLGAGAAHAEIVDRDEGVGGATARGSSMLYTRIKFYANLHDGYTEPGMSIVWKIACRSADFYRIGEPHPEGWFWSRKVRVPWDARCRLRLYAASDDPNATIGAQISAVRSVLP